jgi:hypothetical protein
MHIALFLCPNKARFNSAKSILLMTRRLLPAQLQNERTSDIQERKWTSDNLLSLLPSSTNKLRPLSEDIRTSLAELIRQILWQWFAFAQSAPNTLFVVPAILVRV